MVKVLDTTEHLYTPAKAVAIAAELQSGDEDGWTYTAVHDPKGVGYSYVAIYDEDGEFVAKV
jgi:DUF438 domain-containing protein